jgi:uncharacterized membrane protein (UPF0127 family)
MVSIEVNGKPYKVKVADTPELREKGLQKVKELPKDEGMLFIFEDPQDVGFWMKDTLIPLEIIFIDEYGEVKAIFKGEPESEEMHEANNIKYVLEVNINSGISVGDDVDLSEVEDDEEAEVDEVKMVILDANGEAQMELKGGERIFSRPNTKTLVKLAKRAYKSKSDKDYKMLGRKVFKFLETQNNKEEDYVELPD